jgi:hypothetical protein
LCALQLVAAQCLQTFTDPNGLYYLYFVECSRQEKGYGSKTNIVDKLYQLFSAGTKKKRYILRA